MWHWILGLWLVFQGVSAFGGSPFYLTVERSFRHTEVPTVRLDYLHNKPTLRLRIMKPENYKDFLSKHFLVSRAYEKPQAMLNPAHYIHKGLNRLESPFETLRGFVDTGFKVAHVKGFSKTLKVLPVRRLSKVPDEIMIEVPKGFRVVEDLYLDLSKEHERSKDAVPGFEDWFSSTNGRYQQRSLALPKLEPGVYLVEGLQGKNEAQALLQVSDLALWVQQSEKTLVIKCLDHRTLKPKAGLDLWIRNPRGHWTKAQEKTSKDGHVVVRQTAGFEGRLLVAAVGKGHFGLVSTDFLKSRAQEKSLYLMTDRPMFKPGEEVHFKGIIKGLETQDQEIEKVQLLGAKGLDQAMDEYSPLTSFGTFSGRLDLDGEQEPGLYALRATIGEAPYQGEFRVRDYIKPTFFLKLLEESGSLRPGSTYAFKLQAERYAGGPPKDARYEVFVYRKAYEEPQWIAEAGGGLSAGVDYQGQTKTAQGVALPTRLYSSVEERGYQEGGGAGPWSGTWAFAPSFDQSGQAQVEVTLPKELQSKEKREWLYSLVVKARDVQGTHTVFRKSSYETLSGVVVQLSSPRPVINPQDKVKVQIRSVFPDGRRAGHGQGVLQFQNDQGEVLEEYGFKTDADGVFKGVYDSPQAPIKIKMVARLLEREGKALEFPAKSTPVTLLIPDRSGKALTKNSGLELYPLTSMVAQGGKAEMLVLLPEDWGDGEEGIVWQAQSRGDIERVKHQWVTGRSLMLEVDASGIPPGQTGFFETVTVPLPKGRFAEKTTAFRVMPKNRMMRVSFTLPDVVEPFMGTKVTIKVTDLDGQPKPGVEVALSVVDEGVYALQPEIRPSIVDFFFPLPRLNFSSFHNLNLQGYGYADAITTPNFSLGALKPRTKRALRLEKDTAAFLPHLVTGADGTVDAAFTLPSNETIWRVTAVALGPEGEVGESVGEFRTQAKYSVAIHAPSFLRRGDELQLPVTLRNLTDQAIQLGAALSSNEEGLTIQPADLGMSQVEGRSETVLNSRVKAKQALGESLVELALKVEGRKDIVQKDVLVEHRRRMFGQQIASKPQLGSSSIDTPLPVKGRLGKLEVTARPGLLGLALNAAPYLARYPYGCTEQLVSATIPNLVLFDLIKGREKKLGKDVGLPPSLAKARQLADIGISKILGRQTPLGGFRMWPDDKKPSISATVIALEGLKIAGDLGADFPWRAYHRGKRWLKRHLKLSDELSDSSQNYLAVRLARISGNWRHFLPKVLSYEGDHPLLALTALEVMAVAVDKKATFDKSRVPALTQTLKEYLRSKNAKAGPIKTAADFKRLGFPTKEARIVAASLGVLHRFGELTPDVKEAGILKLAGFMSRGYWHSTFDTAQVILSLRPVITKEIEGLDAPQQSFELKDANQKILANLEPSFPGYRIVLDDFNIPLSSLTALSLSPMPLNHWVNAQFEVLSEEGLKGFFDQGFKVTRQLFKIDGTRLTPVDDQTVLASGDTVISQLTIDLTAPASARWGNLLVVRDEIPSFARPIEDDLEILVAHDFFDPKINGQIKRVVRRPERVEKILEWPYGAKKIVLASLWQVALAGQVRLPPAEVFAMYDEGTRGYSKPVSLKTSIAH